MPSTYSPLLRLELIGAGEQSGLWGDTTNKNLGTLLEQAVAGVAEIPLVGGAGVYDVEVLDGTSDQARCAVLKFTGFPTGPKTIRVPATEKLYVVRNESTQNIVIKTAAQISNPLLGGVDLKPSEATLVFCDGEKAVAGIETDDAGTLGVSRGGTGQSNFPTPGFLKTPGGQGGFNSAAAVNAATEITGVLPLANGGTNGLLPVANGGTGVNTLASGGLVRGAGPTSPVTVLLGTANGQVATWDNNQWIAAVPAPQATIPAGVIVMWSGLTTSVPTGWVLCNGNNATPDLRDRFVVGAGATYSVQATGGSADAIVVTHSHSFSGSGSGSGTTNSALGTHTHSFSGSISGGSVSGSTGAMSANRFHNHSLNDPSHAHIQGSSGAGPVNGADVSEPSYGPQRFTSNAFTGISINAADLEHTHTFSGSISGGSVSGSTGSSPDLGHNHSVTISTTITGTTGTAGSSGTNANLPPYLALAYIMKT